jgi:hypothetical protein
MAIPKLEFKRHKISNMPVGRLEIVMVKLRNKNLYIGRASHFEWAQYDVPTDIMSFAKISQDDLKETLGFD